MNDLVTVIMPIWKIEGKFLIQSIESVLNQSYRNLELLIIYEKSDTNRDIEIQNILKQYSEDVRLRIILTKKKGLANSLNEGIAQAKGKFIARMDADDISEENRLEEQIKFLKDNNMDLIGSWAFSISEDDKIIGNIEPPQTSNEIRKKIMFHNPFLHPSIIFRKEVIDNVGQYNTAFNGAEDYELYFRIIAKGYKVGNIPKYLIKLRERSNSIMRGENWKKNRKIAFQVKKNALQLGFCSISDLFYFAITPLTYIISPKNALFFKNNIGYSKKSN